MSTFTTLLWIICVLNTISKTYSYQDYNGHDCSSPRYTLAPVNSLSDTFLNCSFWSTQLTWYFGDSILSGSLGKSHGISVQLFSPIRYGNYTCQAGPCIHIFNLQPCPPTKLAFVNSDHLQLNCSLVGQRILWTYNKYRLVEFVYSPPSAHGFGEIPSHLYYNYFVTHFASRQQLHLQAPFTPGEYSCHVGSCKETFILFNRSSNIERFTTNYFRNQVVLFTDDTTNVTLNCACFSYDIVTWTLNGTLWLTFDNQSLIVKNFNFAFTNLSSYEIVIFAPFNPKTTLACQVLFKPCQTNFKFVYLPPQSVKLIEKYNSTPALVPKTFYHWLTYAGLLALVVFFLLNIFICFLPSSLFAQAQLLQKNRFFIL
ncbi:E3 CR1-alpha1 [Simian adenovirus 3]|uniref:E3 CR1-alpha1 n=1 Tax=Simian adenovirus 3 TaxID=38420 RepID=A0A9W3HRM3_9ADEN|nr:E3 CR1-alpha1 [Simian adenovirus 3]AAT84635.1 E3 CR1-alpha1 [Simian adenovirus 3]